MIRRTVDVIWDRWANFHPLLRFALATLVVAAAGFFTAKPAWHAFKAWRVDRNLAAAGKAVEEVRMDEARDLSLTVLRAGDPRVEAYRILEKSTAALRDPRHGEIARALMTHPQGSGEDRWRGFAGLAAESPLGVVGQAWTMLPEGSRREARFAVAFGNRLLAEKRSSEAASVLLQVPENQRTAEVSQALARVLAGSGKKQGYDEAQKLISAGISADTLSGWLDALDEIPAESLQTGLLGPVREACENAAGPRPALTLARLDYAADFSRRPAILEAAITRWKDAEPAALAEFLAGLGLDNLLVETISPDRPGLALPLLEAMERAGAWDRAAKLLDAENGALPKSTEFAHRALVAAKTGDNPELVRQWDAALGEARADQTGTALLAIQRLARDAGMDDQAHQAMLEAIRLGRGPLPLYADQKPLLAALAAQGRENQLLEVCVNYLAFEPQNPVLRTRYAYFACMNDLAAPEDIVKAMEPLAKAFPKELPIQCVLAAAHLCDGQPARAAATLDPLQLDPAKLAPSYRAVFLTSQVLNKRLKKFDAQIADFPWKSLQTSERRKLAGLIQAAPQ